MKRFVLGCLTLSLGMAAEAQSDIKTCFGSCETTIRAVHDVVDVYNCQHSGSLLACHQNVVVASMVATGAAVSGALAVRSELTRAIKDLCDGKISQNEFPWSLLTPEMAHAAPSTCRIDAKGLKFRLDQTVEQLDKSLSTGVKKLEANQAEMRKKIVFDFEGNARLKHLIDLEAEIKANPRNFLESHAANLTGAEQARELTFADKKKLASLQEMIESAKLKANKVDSPVVRAELDRIFRQIRNEVPNTKEVTAILDKPIVNVAEQEFARIYKIDNPMQRWRELNRMAERYPSLRTYANNERILNEARMNLSQYKMQASHVRLAEVKTAEDVMNLAKSIELPKSLEETSAAEVAQTLSRFRSAMFLHLGPDYAKMASTLAVRSTVRWGARSLALAATVVGSTTAFAADLMTHSASMGCDNVTSATLAQPYEQILDSDCHPVGLAMNSKTMEFMQTHSNSEICTRLQSDKEFCSALKGYQGQNNHVRFKAQCTATGFRLVDRTSDKAKTFDFDADSATHVSRVRILASGNKADETNFALFLDDQGSVKEVRRPNIGASANEKVQSFSDPKTYQAFQTADLLKSENPDKYSVGAIMDFNQALYAFSGVQNCCFDYNNSDSAECSRYGIEKSQVEKIRGASGASTTK